MYNNRAKARFFNKVSIIDQETGCWIWKGSKDGHGYGEVGVSGDTKKAHRIMWEIAFGEIPDGMNVCHHCDNPICVNPNHLFLGTDSDNMRDMVAKGRASNRKGSSNGRHKLTEETVCDIRRRYANSFITQQELADEFGVCQSLISKCIVGTTWKHVE